MVVKTNAWFHHKEPWRDVSPDGNPENMSPRLQMILTLSAEALRICGIFLQPYMPGKAKQLLDQLEVDQSRRGWADAELGADTKYGNSKVAAGRSSNDVLFPPVVMN